MTTTDPTAGPQIVSGDYDEAAAHHDAMLREIESLRSQLAEAREQRDQAAEALVRAETERDEALCAITKIAEVLGFPGGDLREAIHALRRERDDALQEAESVGRQLHSSTREVDRLIAQLATVTEERDEARAEIARLERAAHEQGADLWTAEDWANWLRKRIQLAMDLLCSPTVPHEPGPDVPSAYGILSHALAATAPETAESPQTDEQAQVRADTHTGAETGSDGPLTPAWCRTQLQRLYIAASESGLRWRDYDVVGAVIEELATLRARVREWEQTLGDLAARCDSGDIPTRLGERYSLAVLREIDRLRTERDRLRRRLGDVLDLEELPEDHTIVAAVRRLRAALGTTPDTGSTHG